MESTQIRKEIIFKNNFLILDFIIKYMKENIILKSIKILYIYFKNKLNKIKITYKNNLLILNLFIIIII